MKVWGVAPEVLRAVAESFGFRLYNDSRVGRATQFVLRPGPAMGNKYRRTSASFYGGFRKDGTPRRVWAVCYHGHWDFMEALFALNPEARVKTAKADYRGLAGFNALAPAVGDQNIGARIAPVAYADACLCDH
jgi:hypothetical protein